ncbi:hypothetical protein B4135_2577 [Caldibacillus debilis]|uniref:Uncharacterized protein n=1 Tax=Caldibacillus debilis TaxID=301148 RepID=A0A150LXB1_9BACI|nr:hypothetical protein B4135_2577 [Caldibacillus debilis]
MLTPLGKFLWYHYSKSLMKKEKLPKGRIAGFSGSSPRSRTKWEF